MLHNVVPYIRGWWIHGKWNENRRSLKIRTFQGAVVDVETEKVNEMVTRMQELFEKLRKKNFCVVPSIYLKIWKKKILVNKKFEKLSQFWIKKKLKTRKKNSRKIWFWLVSLWIVVDAFGSFLSWIRPQFTIYSLDCFFMRVYENKPHERILTKGVKFYIWEIFFSHWCTVIKFKIYCR